MKEKILKVFMVLSFEVSELSISLFAYMYIYIRPIETLCKQQSIVLASLNNHNADTIATFVLGLTKVRSRLLWLTLT